MSEHAARNQQLVERIKGLGGDKRRLLFAKLHEMGIDVARLPIVPAAVGERLPLSYAQQRQWFLWQLEPTASAYHIPTALVLRGALDIARLHDSFARLVERHASLRTRFVEVEGQMAQVIDASTPVVIEQTTLEASGPDREQRLRDCVAELAAQPFDLQQGPLLRVRLARLAEGEHLLVLVLHHIVTDGWSMSLMVEELMAHYAGVAPSLASLPVQYGDFAAWQRQWMESGERERQLGYWKAQLGDPEQVLELPTDHPRPASMSFAGARLALEMPPALQQGLRQLAHRQGVSLFVLLLASFQSLLQRYSGQDEIRVGVPVANRNRLETERLIGLFVNTQVLAAQVHGEEGFAALLRRVDQQVREAQEHQDLPFEHLVEALGVSRSLSHNPLFQAMYNHQDGVRQAGALGLPGLTVEALEWDAATAQLDLTLETQDSGQALSAALIYATDLFEPARIGRMAKHWLNLLHGIVANPQAKVAELPLLDAEERALIVEQWNDTAVTDYPLDTPVHQLIEQQVLATPDAPALRFGEQALSYFELNQRANQLAHQLIALGVGPEVLVGIAVERSLEMVVGLLAILKAGGAYVPLDPEYPEDRLAYMIEDSRIGLLLTQSHLNLPCPESLPKLNLDTLSLDGFSVETPVVEVAPEHLAYVIYTSGSTGKPKGAGNRHKALTNRLCWMQQAYGLGVGDTVLQKTPFSFDVSVWEFFWPLMTGARLAVAGPGDHRDPRRLVELINEHQVSTLHFVPSMLQMFLLDEQVSSCTSLRRIVCSGEALPVDAQDQVLARLPDAGLYNLYGPTEAAIDVTHWTCRDEGRDAVPIGQPIANLQTYVLDAELQPVPAGVVGELYLGGEGLARGYHRRPALTAERFVTSPFGNGQRLYRTGDLASQRADGVIEYRGRIDHQVKIRGLRIELGEIEARLMEQDAVREAVVLAIDGALIGYVVPSEWQPETQEALRETLREPLRQALPDYMVPSQLLFIERMPLSPNGKLERKALPKPDASQAQKAYVAPRTELEQRIATIWQDVLKLERVGLNDNFFELGGHSLLATQVRSRIRQQLDLDIALRTLFEHSTLAAFCQALSQAESDARPALLPATRDQALPLSYAQERQWFLWQLQPDSAAYHIPAALRLRGTLDKAALATAFDGLVARHESLRTTFIEHDGQAVQHIAAATPLAIVYDTLAPGAEQQQRIRDYVQAQVQHPFDLRQGPLLRVNLLRVAEDEHVLLLVQHHIVSDAWSMQVMVEELVHRYHAAREGQDATLPAMTVQYADYALWQRQWMEAGERERQLAYWKAQLGAATGVLELPTDHPRPATLSARGGRVPLALDAKLGEQLRQLAQAQNVTLFMLLLASFQALLHRYSGQSDIRVGVPIANRDRLETERLIGFFVNTQVLKAEFSDQQVFLSLLQQAREAALGAQQHQELPFEQLVEALQPERSLSHNPLFQAMYNHQDAVHQSDALTLPGLSVEALEWDAGTAQLDLTLETQDSGQGLSAVLIYASDLFEQASVERMGRHWLNLLHGIVANPQAKVAELPLLDAEERAVIVEQWNDTAVTDYPLDTPVHQLIEQQVLATPDAPALRFGEQKLSYFELNQRANQLAHQLIALGVGPEVLVGIAVERSLEMVVGLLAILKAGGAYVPLDPEYPEDRLAYMIEDSRIGLLLTQSHLNLPCPESLPKLNLDTLSLDGFSVETPLVEVAPEHLAYVIYTSGSTGKPKGAGNRHKALTNRLCWMQQAYGLGLGDTVLQKTPFSFDVSVWEFFWPLMTGARLAVAGPGDHRDPRRLVELINEHQVSTLHFVPSMLQMFLLDEQVSSCTSLRRIVCSGEALPVDAQDQVLARLPNAGLYNLYGPTEAAIDVTHWTCRDEGRDAVPIGQPIANLQTYVLDAELQPVPAGVVGELYLGGEGLARGYHRRPALTAERFVTSPFGEGQRLYRTGDLASQRADGVIEYRGRIDHQVKIRGLRIELGEIEARLMEQDAVREAVVLAIDGALIGYVVPSEWQPETQEALRETLREPLRQALPDYMVPSQLLFIERMPLSPNGKLERKALPKPDASQAQKAYVAPRTELEQRIATIWQDVLKLERVGLNDNFFELGGDSIISIQVVSRARQAGIRFTPKDLFQHQTVRDLAHIARLDDSAPLLEHAPANGEAPLLPIQRRFFAEIDQQRHHWNQSVLLKPNRPVDAQALAQALQALVQHHDALRLVFTEQAGDWSAHFLDTPPAPVLEQRQATYANLRELANETQRSLDLANGPLLRAVLITLEDHSQRLLLVIHHLVVDGVSWRILFDDLQTAYTQAASGEALRLAARTTSVKAWAERLQQHIASPSMQEELAYWQAQLDGLVTALPADRPQGSLSNQHAQALQLRLDRATTRRLLQDAPQAYRTQVNDLLLTALARAVARWSGQPQVAVQLEGHGREALFDELDLTRTVGWFTSLFPVRLSTQDDLGANLRDIKETLRNVPAKGVGYNILRELGQGLHGLPEPRITFNYLGQFDTSFAASDDALFTPAAEGSGEEQSRDARMGNWLTLNGQVYDGGLSLSWLFSDAMFDRATVQALADDYQRELHALVEHCCNPGNRGVTPSDFPLARVTQAQLQALPLAAGQVEDLYPLSPMQQGMLFHTLEAAEAGLYINQMAVDVEGLDIERFRAAWDAVIARHDILRTGFWSDNQLAEPLQVVQRHAQMPLSVLDWRDRAVDAADLSQLAAQDYTQGFDLLRAPLMRLTLVRLDEQRAHLLWSGHHILVDGWSNSRLLGEVLQAYHGHPAPASGGRYRDYIQWLARQPQDALERFWRDQLRSFDSPTHLASALGPRPDASLQGHAALYLDWDAAHTAQLREQARALRVTPNTLIQAAWLLLLQRYTGQASVCFGATVAGRPASLPGADEMLGLFINTLPVIQQPQPTQSVQQWLLQLQASNLDIRDYEHASLADIQRWAGLGGQAMFDSIIVFENYPVDERLQQAEEGQLRFGQVQGRDVTNFAMDLAVNLGNTLSIEFLYLRNRFSEAAVAQIKASFETLLHAMLAQPDTRLGNLALLDAAQGQRLRLDNTLRPASGHAPLLVEQLRQQAEARPQAIAVTCNEQQLTWAALDSRANRLANHLIAQGVAPESRVGVALERSVEMIVAFYAVMKAGAAYVPLDIDYPQERLKWIVEDSGMALMITQASLQARFDWPGAAPQVLLDTLPLHELPAECPPQRALGDNLAYLIYTSGSTGKPKGVAVANEPIRMHCAAIAERYGMTRETRELLFMSFAFDGAQERWLTTLSCGGQLVLRDNQLWTPEQTWHALHQHAISVACFPPAYLQQLAEFAQTQEQAPPPVSIYCFGGDAVAEANFELVKQALRPQWLTNGYGPTETVVTPLLWKVAADGECGAVYAPIGSRVGERTLYVLDDALNPLPPGVAGELYLGGQGVARGYHQRPGLSAERFVADPFSSEGGRLYRTGDLVRQREDGTFDYLGRLDNQVKIRGFRIELGEIEARLRDLPQVQDAVVVAREHADGKQLVGYVVANGTPGEQLRTALLEELPDYMVPAQVVVLDALPLNPNGKVDRNALPDPQFKGRTFVAPRDALEQALAAIWQEVLEVERVGVTDNFFELGGDSLRVLKVLSKVRGMPELGLQLKLRDLMGKPTIAELSGHVPESRSMDPLVALNASLPGGPALFCLHAGFGTVFDYEALARRLEGRCSVYGLQCRMLLDDAWEDESLEAMALDYAQYIRQKQPQGPYHLLGWSLGGPLVSLVAQELLRQGQRVAFAGLVDSFVPQTLDVAPDDDCADDLRGLLSVVLGVPLHAVPTLAVSADDDLARLEQAIDQARQAMNVAQGALSEMPSDELARTFRTGMKLKALSLQLSAMPQCPANSHCWWAGRTNDLSDPAFDPCMQHAPITADHYAILRHPAFLDSLLRHLPLAEAVTP